MDALGTADYLIAGEKWKEAKQVLDIVRPFCQTVNQLDAIGAKYAAARDWQTAGDIAFILYNTVTGEAKNNARESMIKCLIQNNKPEKALYYLNEDETLFPAFNAERELNKSVAYFMCNEKKKSENILQNMLNRHHIEPDMLTRIKFNLASHKMNNGLSWKVGLRDFLSYGRQLDIWKECEFPKNKQWKETNPPNNSNHIFIVAEGGIGDEFINFRFAKRLHHSGHYFVHWVTDRHDLIDVFKRHGISTLTTKEALKEIKQKPDYIWAYSMDLPVRLGLSEYDLWDGPYICADKTNMKVLPITTKKKIGLKFQGNQYYEHNLHRTVPHDDILNMLTQYNTNNYIFDLDIDFMKNTNAGQIYLNDQISSWEDTLNYIEQMDLIITSCTSIAHAASAMAKPTVVLVPIMNYYTWTGQKTFSDWYSMSTLLIHQKSPGCWKQPIIDLKTHLDFVL